jgi:site-specific recombinase XerD
LVDEELIEASPMRKFEKPRCPASHIAPSSAEQIDLLFTAAERSTNPLRDKAMLFLLLDTGMRASELCGLRMCDLDLMGGVAL